MKHRPSLHFTLCITALAAASSAWAVPTVADFEDLPLAPNSFYNGGPVTNTNGWSSNGVHFGNSYNSSFGGFWNGWSYSNVNNTTTPGFTNQYAAFTGTGFGGGGNYAVGYDGSHDYINLPPGAVPASARVTNTTYAALSMLNGDSFAKKFGGPTGNDPDFFSVVFTGYDAPNGTGNVTGTPVEFFLADYRFANNSLDYVVNTWELVDLTPLGNAASLRISFTSSDVGAFGINTPSYVALDNLTLIPEPGFAWALLGGVAGGFMRRRR
jgi:hypothetical protein